MNARLQPARTQELLVQLADADPSAAQDAALELGDRREYGAVPVMLDILGATPHAGVRNAVAYALSAMRIPETFEIVADLLHQDRTRGARSTLLYALRPFDCTSLLPRLVDLVIEDTWESAREAAYLITEIDILPAETWLPLRNRLRTAHESVDVPYAVNHPERRDIIGFLIEFFQEEPDEPA